MSDVEDKRDEKLIEERENYEQIFFEQIVEIHDVKHKKRGQIHERVEKQKTVVVLFKLALFAHIELVLELRVIENEDQHCCEHSDSGESVDKEGADVAVRIGIENDLVEVVVIHLREFLVRSEHLREDRVGRVFRAESEVRRAGQRKRVAELKHEGKKKIEPEVFRV